MRMSHARVNSNPPPIAVPEIAAITGLGISSTPARAVIVSKRASLISGSKKKRVGLPKVTRATPSSTRVERTSELAIILPPFSLDIFENARKRQAQVGRSVCLPNTYACLSGVDQLRGLWGQFRARAASVDLISLEIAQGGTENWCADARFVLHVAQ